MNITLLTTNNIHNNKTINQSNHVNNKYGLQADTVSFGGVNKKLAIALENGIEEMVNSSSLNIGKRISFHTLLDRAMPEIMKPENFINKGRDSKVYEISEKYVAKIRRGTLADDAIHFYSMTEKPGRKFKKIDFFCPPLVEFQGINLFDRTITPNHKFRQLDIYYGEPLVRVGNVEILKNATPTKDYMYCGIPYSRNVSKNASAMEKYEQEYLPLCSSLPQSSFDEFAYGLQQLNSIRGRAMSLRSVGYIPDVVNPNNILIANNRFKIVDQLEPVKEKSPNSLYTMVEPLIMRLTPEKYAKDDPSLRPYRDTIYKKCLIAAEKAGLPLDSPVKDEFADYYLGGLISQPRSGFLSTEMTNLRKQHVPLNQRLERIEELYRDIKTV